MGGLEGSGENGHCKVTHSWLWIVSMRIGTSQVVGVGFDTRIEDRR